MTIEIENTLYAVEDELKELEYLPEYDQLYEWCSSEMMKFIFSKLHYNISKLFILMNGKLSTNYYLAQDSRNLITCIESVNTMYNKFKNTEAAFEVDSYYKEIFLKCQNFLSKSGGSLIPPNIEKIDIYYKKPIFLNNEISIITRTHKNYYNRKLIGEGSYAKVYRYKDEFYDKKFIVKVAKNDLSEKELERFKQEFLITKSLNSPYIIDVYSYDENSKEYYMEFMDFTLYDYIKKYNNQIEVRTRKSIVNQILRAFDYIHSKNYLHRDITPKNVLLKKYDDVLVVKISDFGLVKTPESQLTSYCTEMKGYCNDPNLKFDGFSNYDITHEIYALTYLIFFICTGKDSITGYTGKLKDLVLLGMNPNKNLRPKNITELKNLFEKYY